MPEDALRWSASIAVAVATVGLVIVALASAPASIRTNNERCLQQIANEEHTSLEAFFQNPAEQDAFVEAVTVCSR
jgi:Na+/glutamate symporter